MSSGKGSGDARTTSSATTSNVTTTNVDNRVYQSDFGAVQGGIDLSSRALDTAVESIGIAGGLVRDVIDSNADTVNRSFSFGRDLTAGASSFAESLFGTALQAIGDFASEGQAQIGNTVSALNNIAKEQSTSSDERVQKIAQVALMIGGGIVAAVIVAMMMKGR